MNQAAAFNKKEVAGYLISLGMDINDNNDNMGYTPLHWAVEGDAQETIKLLVEKGADPRIENKEGYNPLEMALERGNLDDKLRRVGFLLSSGVDANLKNKRGETLLHDPGQILNIEIARLLISKGADVNARDENGRTPIFTVAQMTCSVEHAELLISNGAKVNAKDIYGLTPLHWAAFSGCVKVAELIISKGANVNARTKKKDDEMIGGIPKGVTPLDIVELIQPEKLNEMIDLLKKHGGKRSKDLK